MKDLVKKGYHSNQSSSKRGKCIIHGCKKPKGKNTRKCGMHHTREWKSKNPLKAAFRDLRSNAKRRRKAFTITFEDFVELVEQTEYMDERGRRWFNLHIDRMDEDFGYVPGNCQILSHADNRMKYIKYRKQLKENEPF